MFDLALIPHPDFPSTAVRSITAEASRSRGGSLTFRFEVDADLDGVVWPPLDVPVARVDELWKHTCFEAFVGFVDQPAYCEFNFTAMQWAAYQFDGYRDGMRDITDANAWGSWHPEEVRAVKSVRVPMLAGGPLRLNLTAIIEATDGTKSYWALAHPPGKPDFHDPACFVATLPAP